MEFNHRVQRPDLRLDGFTGAGFFQVMKPAMRRFQTGRLIQHVIEHLTKVHRVRVGKVNFSLLNVCSAFSHYSHGFLPPPPQAGWPAFNHLMFTFSMTHEDYTQDYPVNQKWQLNNVAGWGDQYLEYITVGVSSIQATQMGLNSLMAIEMDYLYNLIGVVSKNLIVHSQMGLFREEDWDRHYSQPLDTYTSRYKSKGLHGLFRDVPYPHWVFSDYVWDHAPNLLHPRMINAKTAEWYFRNTHESSRKLSNTDAARGPIFGLGTNGKEGLTREVFKSLVSMMQSMRSKQALTSPLAPMILMGMVYEGESKIFDSMTDLPSMTELFGSDEIELDSVFSQPVTVAERMVKGDSQLANSLMNEVDF